MAATVASPSPVLYLSFTVLIFFHTISFSSAYQLGELGLGRKVGGRIKIKEVGSNKEIQAIGKFSVEEYNKILHTHLTFFQVVEAHMQVVSGIKYYIKIHAMDAAENLAQKEFDAVVVERLWFPSKQLISFAPSTTTL